MLITHMMTHGLPWVEQAVVAAPADLVGGVGHKMIVLAQAGGQSAADYADAVKNAAK